MVKSIHIQNFRCFEDFQLDGFGRVNLIGGMNNSGKTILLEALLLGNVHLPQVFVDLKSGRIQDSNVFKKEDKSIVWDELFFNREKAREITVVTGVEYDVLSEQKCFYKLGGGTPLTKGNIKGTYYLKNEKYLEVEIKIDDQGDIHFENERYENSINIDIKENNGQITYLKTKGEEQLKELAIAYSTLEVNGFSEYVLKGIKAIDDSITEIKVLYIGEPTLYLKRKNEPLMPIHTFGDATPYIARVTLAMIEAKNGVILIDEIENGIHYTNQPKVWELIFKLANKFNVQIFATTHSKEMVQAFNKVALEGRFEEDAKYIEMARHYKTKRIIGTVLETNILKHKLEHNQPFRGE